MRNKRLIAGVISGTCALAIAGCSSSATDSVDGGTSGGAVQLIAQPGDGGQVITGAIESATKTVDIPIYSIGGDEITAALTKAKAKGVAIRIMVNGGYGNYPPGVQALQKTLNAAPGTGSAKIQWSSNNFNVTHQKSVIVDAADANGNALQASDLPATAKVVISTGNFQDFAGPFWSARDYDMVTNDPQTVAAVEGVFVNDYGCPGYTVINPQGLTANDRLVWSNGSTGLPTANQYPTSYPLPQRGTGVWADGGYTVQGNGRDAYLGFITSAGQGDIIRFSNEELTDPEIVDALTKAATPTASGGQGADVRIIMSLPKGYTAATASQFAGSLSGVWKIVKAGGTAHMFTNNATDTDALYVHAKIAAMNSEKAFLGSENAGYMSLNANRELGMNLTSDDAQAMSTLISTFDEDWAQGAKWVTIWTRRMCRHRRRMLRQFPVARIWNPQAAWLPNRIRSAAQSCHELTR